MQSISLLNKLWRRGAVLLPSLALVLMISLSVSTLASEASVRLDLPSDKKLQSVAIEDLGSNPRSDRARGPSTVLTPLNDGLFAEATYYPAGDKPNRVAIEDLNGDQVPDLVVANRLTNNQDLVNNVAVLLGLGDGTFDSPRFYDSGEGAGSRGLAIEDLNGDQVPDLVLTNRSAFVDGSRVGDDNVAVLLGLGDGTFDTPSFYDVGALPTSIALGDLNADLVPDLVVATEDNVAVLRGIGDGRFGAPSFYEVGESPSWVVIERLNGDQTLDLAVVGGGFKGYVAMLLGLGDGTFFHQAQLSDAGNYPSSFDVEDLDGDQLPDLAVPNSFAGSTAVAVLRNSGGGLFAAPSFSEAGEVPRSVVIEDLNNDLLPDLAVANFASNNVAVLTGLGNGSFAEASFYPAGDGPNFVAVEDLNGDQIYDLAVATFGGNVAVLLGVGTADPVELSFFDASPKEGGVALRWRTGWERDVHGFHVLRATTSEINDANRVTGSLIRGGEHAYEFIDWELSPGRYWYWLEEVTRSGALHHYGPRSVHVLPLTPALLLAQNRPNPFHDSTKITFSVPAPSPVSLGVYDATGRLIRSLLDQEVVGIGEQQTIWDGYGDHGEPVASGIYFYRLRVGDHEMKRKIHLLR